uniref:Phosphatidic acid phosphatase type 2/haloperoxidase domain-containing protein n=1 Tax=Chromera velia CCMP2878 TaxID=1169474 RepID=A0A0G4GMY5_9ALVE|eukprot:Cvel_4936.t1-p1 / transcript=Cvel_4936.t1 / gene=Cvel_4936 / organism=Chromera_velia_CCMP2878 / gene_product=hypothetical protein / transcript_product=hypothetical protein / location=Cvel_scaffold223:33671-37284(-) / protein_length=703 / sequence_SO=supercontig / SO=protein_coding / is_pseudo=false
MRLIGLLVVASFGVSSVAAQGAAEALSPEAVRLLTGHLGRPPALDTPPYASSWLTDWNSVLLRSIKDATTYGGPTYGSRWLFLFNESVYRAWKWGLNGGRGGPPSPPSRVPDDAGALPWGIGPFGLGNNIEELLRLRDQRGGVAAAFQRRPRGRGLSANDTETAEVEESHSEPVGENALTETEIESFRYFNETSDQGTVGEGIRRLQWGSPGFGPRGPARRRGGFPGPSLSPPLLWHHAVVETAAYLALRAIFSTRGVRDEESFDVARLTRLRDRHAEQAGSADPQAVAVLEEAAASAELSALIGDFLQSRDGDGWWTARNLRGEWANQNAEIKYNQDRALTQVLEAELPEMYSWTPLEVVTEGNNNRASAPRRGRGRFGFGPARPAPRPRAERQSYLTPEWGSVTPLISDGEFDRIVADASGFFPNSREQLETEMLEVLDLSQNLGDREKVIAEFWAGNPGTVAPPGFMQIFLIWMIGATPSLSLNLDAQVLLFRSLSSAVFQAGLFAWTLKRRFLETRPIQTIRILRAGTPTLSWQTDPRTGRQITIGGEQWVPYQPSNGVNDPTPPFPDFVSGHSAFSAAGADMLRALLRVDGLRQPGSAPSVPRTDLLPLMSPMFDNGQTTPEVVLGQLSFLRGTSLVEPGLAPSQVVTLSWANFEELKQEAGLSRLWGGIHPISSHNGGRRAGELTTQVLLRQMQTEI